MKFGKWVRIPHGLALVMSRKGRIAARQPFGAGSGMAAFDVRRTIADVQPSGTKV